MNQCIGLDGAMESLRIYVMHRRSTKRVCGGSTFCTQVLTCSSLAAATVKAADGFKKMNKRRVIEKLIMVVVVSLFESLTPLLFYNRGKVVCENTPFIIVCRGAKKQTAI